MPLSKAKQAEYQKQRRSNLKLGMTKKIVIPKSDALRANSSPLKEETSPILPMSQEEATRIILAIRRPKVKPELDDSGEIIPEYW